MLGILKIAHEIFMSNQMDLPYIEIQLLKVQMQCEER